MVEWSSDDDPKTTLLSRLFTFSRYSASTRKGLGHFYFQIPTAKVLN